jgi:photosystem II stability/assembly factor-like uncharacterized protein
VLLLKSAAPDPPSANQHIPAYQFLEIDYYCASLKLAVIEMKRFFTFSIVVVASILSSGCGSGGSPAPAPTGVNVVAGDTQAIVSWTATPGVEYWIFSAVGSGITPQNCSFMLNCKVQVAASPAVVSGLTNGNQYSFTVNGRTNSGPGGPGSPAVQATPRPAGTLWNSQPAIGTADLHGITYGEAFVAVGVGGALFSSSDGVTWTPAVNPVPANNLNAVTYYGGAYIAVGNAGVILRSTDGKNWKQQAIGVTTNDLYAITNNGGQAGFVAVGANGTILASADGTIWSAKTSGTTNTLYGITYGVIAGSGEYVAAGAADTTTGAGTLLYSANAAAWTPVPALPGYDLKGVAYGDPKLAYGFNTPGTTSSLPPLPPPSFVAVGANGTLVSSTDGKNWTSGSLPAANLVTAVTYAHQFVAVDDVGNVFTSPDGTNWGVGPVQNLATPLYAVTHVQFTKGQYRGQYGLDCVGASGADFLSF